MLSGPVGKICIWNFIIITMSIGYLIFTLTTRPSQWISQVCILLSILFCKIIPLLPTYNGQSKNYKINFIYIFFYSVTPVLSKVETKQVVLHNQTSFLWCLAEGAPAPVIAWRKNGLVVQNSTSVRYSMGIVKRNNDNYSCEVKNNEKETMKKEFVISIESELLHNIWNSMQK